jgi:hypothetical protein
MADDDSHSGSPEASEEPTGLSHDELAARELAEMMSSPTFSTAQPEDDDDVDELALDDAPVRDIVLAPALTTRTSASIRNDLAVVRRKSNQFKLHPYQREAAEDLVKVKGFLWPYVPYNCQ